MNACESCTELTLNHIMQLLAMFLPNIPHHGNPFGHLGILAMEGGV